MRSHEVVIWWATPVEVQSTLARLRRAGELAEDVFRKARKRATSLVGGFHQVAPTPEVRDAAIECLERFPLKAADALQLASAWTWVKRKPRNRLFAVMDAQLAAAASELGFDVITPA